MKPITKLIIKLIRETADKLDAGNSELSDSEAVDLLAMLTHRALSKEQACAFLNISRSTFDLDVSLGLIPKGRKRLGFKELVWYEDELRECLKSIKR
jgi:predicted DNA-binding transcriptional regulator AlpA